MNAKVTFPNEPGILVTLVFGLLEDLMVFCLDIEMVYFILKEKKKLAEWLIILSAFPNIVI